MRSFLVALLALGCISTTTAYAADGSSGCGPGWYIFKENTILSSLLRMTTNGILFPVVTLGMTFGTSNCTKHKLVLKEKESLYFVTMNHYELKGDIAMGRGEYLSAFAETMGCPVSAQQRLNHELRGRYSSIYPERDVTPENVLREVYTVILTDRELTNKCSLGVS